LKTVIAPREAEALMHEIAVLNERREALDDGELSALEEQAETEDDLADEQMGSTSNYLDMTALGRQEEWEHSPEGYPQTPPHMWWNYHDAYDAGK
jgi:predicted dithiol-disulfide oxidoreductase (DUF899 family)